jgi:hypothetical protein
MRKELICALICLAGPLDLFAQSSANTSPDLKFADTEKMMTWLLKKGPEMKDKEIARLKNEKDKQGFVRDELLELYIEVQSDLKVQREFYVYCFKEMGSEEFSFHSKSQKKEMKENEERAIRILEILSKMPATSQEVKLSK